MGLRGSGGVPVPATSRWVTALLVLTLVGVVALYCAYANMGFVEAAVESLVAKLAIKWNLD